jgi:1-acyl-sn-glycerol-3-phosphate acyltransferase
MIIQDSYFTPPQTRRYLLDRLLPFLASFRIRLLIITRQASKIALKGQYTDEEWVKSSDRMFRLMERSGGKFRITGMENLHNATKPLVIISNHMSTIETLVFPGLIRPITPVTFVVKDSLVKGNFFGPVMRSRDPIVVGRKNSREDLMRVISEGKEKLAKGISVVIFPQSTRQVIFNPEEFNSLGVKLAAKAGVQVVPVAIKTDFWKNGKPIKELGRLDRKQPICIKFGEPMDINGNGKEENDAIIHFIQTNLDAWNSETRD